jgi:glycerol-3-phosphate acyltransferase PlsX
MKILLDAMGGDNAPDANIRGAVSAIDEIDAEVVLIGQEAVITSKVKEFYGKSLKEISSGMR